MDLFGRLYQNAVDDKQNDGRLRPKGTARALAPDKGVDAAPMTYKHTLRQEEETAEEEVHTEDDDARSDDAGHGRARAKLARKPAPCQAPEAGRQATEHRGDNVGRSKGDKLTIGADRVAITTSVLLGSDNGWRCVRRTCSQ